MPREKKYTYAEIDDILSKIPPFVPEKYITNTPFMSTLTCDDFLTIISIAELSNLDLTNYWEYHDENCDCELNMKPIEPLS
jgi:hypothetical protein